MNLRRSLVLVAALVALLALAPETWAQGCSMCKAVAGSQADGATFGGSQAVGGGLNTGILFMMSVPYLLLFLFFRKRIFGFVKEFRNAQG